MTSTPSKPTQENLPAWSFSPISEIETLARKIKKGEIDSTVKPLVKMEESADAITIEMELPGIKREDIFIYVNDNNLIIIVFHKNSETLKNKLHIQEFDTDFLSEHLLLPETADTEFVCAEYTEGALHLTIPKNPTAPKTLFSQIGVY
jgi:HSP20 family protein